MLGVTQTTDGIPGVKIIVAFFVPVTVTVEPSKVATAEIAYAFKHNLTDGSVSPLAAQLSEKTNYLNQRFLSY